MQLAKSIVPRVFTKLVLLLFFVPAYFVTSAQDNSPYSRYGLGNMVPLANSSGQGLGHLSAAYTDYTGINFVNPATYSTFVSAKEARSNKLQYGRAILDVGISISNRTLIEPNNPAKFTSADALFSYLQIGVPLRKNWGLSFGIRPMSRIGYFIDTRGMLRNPDGSVIDSAITQYKGSGGTYLPTIGTGFGFTLSKDTANNKIKTNTLAFGVNFGYFFGNRETKTLLNLINDTAATYASDHMVTTSFGDIFMNGGLLYTNEVRNNSKKYTSYFRFGFTGNINQHINASTDKKVQTYTQGANGEELQIDSVYEKKDIEGTVVYPASYKAGFVWQRIHDDLRSWMVGVDFTTSKWSDYRFYGQKDSTQDSWQINVGASFNGKYNPTSYFSNVVYRFGFFTGPDYIKVKSELPHFGVTVGFGLPLPNYNRMTRQTTLINLAFEYGKRGNNDNILKENLFRMTLGFNFNDIWFQKRKYD